MSTSSAAKLPDGLRRRVRSSALLLLLLVPACDRGDRADALGRSDPSSAGVAPDEQPAASALIRIVACPGRFAFEPAEVAVPSGGTVRFVLTRSLPESVAFDTAGTTPKAADYVIRSGLHRGTLLTEEGQVYDVSFQDAPPGSYPFSSLPHASRGMRGVVVVEPPR